MIDGESIERQLPAVLTFYRQVNQFVNAVSGKRLVPLNDKQVACNINITPSGGSYRWHYDRNAVTAIVYLNEVAGGETDCYPNYRISLGRRLGRSKLQQGLDCLLQAQRVRRAFGNSVVVEPAAGRLLLMRGDRCLHSVRAVAAESERVNIVMSYDTPNADFAQAGRLNRYLYDQGAQLAGDPNYASHI
ncbi:MAG TPA: 2OG-Fe(II) oxygenase [Burkholderiaceae bacterium]|nr:2OG-Fe(II) oxygenase [Burkholderiaceae bacterium]